MEEEEKIKPPKENKIEIGPLTVSSSESNIKEIAEIADTLLKKHKSLMKELKAKSRTLPELMFG